MSAITKNESNFVGYEYKDVTISRKMETVFADGYVNFGWNLDAVSASIRAIPRSY
jgi:hypothetical protein